MKSSWLPNVTAAVPGLGPDCACKEVCVKSGPLHSASAKMKMNLSVKTMLSAFQETSRVGFSLQRSDYLTPTQFPNDYNFAFKLNPDPES